MSSAPRPSTRRQPASSWVFGVAITVMAGLFIAALVLLFGRVSGEEFSPKTFKRRTFHYYELPGVGIQVWPIRHFDSTGLLEQGLIKQKLIVPDTTPPERWDLVRGFRGASVAAEGDAYFLCRFFDQHSNGKHDWLDWSTNHPELAKAYWPVIDELADRELYFFIPDLFLLARGAEDAEKFRAALSTMVAEKYYQFGLAQQKIGNHAQAVELLTAAIRHSPEKSSTWQKALETSRKEVPTAEAS